MSRSRTAVQHLWLWGVIHVCLATSHPGFRVESGQVRIAA